MCVFSRCVVPGKHKLAVKSVRKALDLHPWAAHLPTMLISMLAERKGAKGGSSSSTSTSTSTGASGSSDSSSSSESSSNSEVRDN